MGLSRGPRGVVHLRVVDFVVGVSAVDHASQIAPHIDTPIIHSAAALESHLNSNHRVKRHA